MQISLKLYIDTFIELSLYLKALHVIQPEQFKTKKMIKHKQPINIIQQKIQDGYQIFKITTTRT